MATHHRQSLFYVPHTLVLLTALAFGSLGFVLWLGLRWVVALSSLVICTAAIAAWMWQLNHHRSTPSAALNSADLLQKNVFLTNLNHIESQYPSISQSLWLPVYQRADTIQQLTAQIAQTEPGFIPDLLETLHTVLDLVEQLAQALRAVQQVKTYRYQQLAQQQLYSSQKRLEQTHIQLQELRDQTILNTLQQQALTLPTEISTWLQTLIQDNKKGILGE